MRAMPLSLDSGSDGHGGLRWQPELRDPAPSFVTFVIMFVSAAAAPGCRVGRPFARPAASTSSRLADQSLLL